MKWQQFNSLLVYYIIEIIDNRIARNYSAERLNFCYSPIYTAIVKCYIFMIVKGNDGRWRRWLEVERRYFIDEKFSFIDMD